MKIVKTASGKNRIKMSKSEWTSIGKKAGWMKEAQGTEVVTRQDGKIILISDWAKGHIQEHMIVGKGSVFSSFPDLKLAAQSAPLQGGGGLYPIDAGGYELVIPIDQAKQLPDAQMTKVQKQERGETIDVHAVKTSAPISDFSTNESYVVIRQTAEEYIPPDVKNEDTINAAKNGNLYSVLTAFPGSDKLPPASQWGDQFAVVIPS